MAKVPERIGKYEVIRRLGYGGMGTVYLARDPDLDRLLAIKVLRDLLYEDELIERFLREARAAGNLRHDNIITVYDAGQHDHQPFMAMEYVDGTSLAELIRGRHPLSLADKLSYLEQICAGLHYAHSRGIVHRDIKPANLMVDRHHIIRILDFGIARIEGSGMTREGALIGTLNYMSPEQMLGRSVDHRSDIFAFGAVAYELIAYEKAFPGSIDDGLLQRLPNEPPRALGALCPGLPDELEPLILRALSKQPQDRFSDLEEARLAIRSIRRELDPSLDIEPIAGGRRSGGGAATPTPGALSERREFLERRARQVAYHRDAARKALQQGDLDAAAAACEDALTLEPADQESLKLLGEIEQAQEQQGLASKERRERERTIRRHLADADLKLSKGDVTTAAQLLQRALTLDPDNTTALEMLSRIEHGGTPPPQPVAPTVVRPQRSKTSTQEAASAQPPESAASPAAHPAPRPWWATPKALAAAAAIVAVAAILWISMRDTDSPPANTVAGSRAPEAPASAAPASTPPPVTTPVPVPVPSIPSLSDAALQERLARVAASRKRGDLQGALAEMRGVLAQTSDDRARAVARSLAADARRTMTEAADSARKQKAADQSASLFGAAERARALSDRAFRADDFVEAGTQAVIATANYSLAERDALAAAKPTAPPSANVKAADPAPSAAASGADAPPLRTPTPAAAPPPAAAAANPPPAPAPAPAPVAAPTPAPTPPPAPVAARSAAVEAANAGMRGALTRYQEAYAAKSMKDLLIVFPSIGREEREGIADQFNPRACRALDVAILNPSYSTTEDAESGTVTARTTYSCQPPTRQPPIVSTVMNVFMLSKAGDRWVIDRILSQEQRAR